MIKLRYGFCYTGSKNSIAERIVEKLPKADVFVDLFCGGCAISHCAIVSGKYKNFVISDYNALAPDLFRRAMNGELRDEKRWISREDFFRLKDTDGYVKWCWSFGSNGDGYIYGEDIEEWKKAMWVAIFEGDYSLGKKFGVDFSAIDKVKGAKNRRLALRSLVFEKLVKEGKFCKKKGSHYYVNKGALSMRCFANAQNDGVVSEIPNQVRNDGDVVRNDGDVVRNDGDVVRNDGGVDVRNDGDVVRNDGETQIDQLENLESLQSIESLQSLESLERLQSLESLQSLERLQSLCLNDRPKVSGEIPKRVRNDILSDGEVVFDSGDYREVYERVMREVESGKWGKNPSVVIYCDPPYKNTGGYEDVKKAQGGFDYDAFYEFVRKTPNCFFSEYNAPDDFVNIFEIEKRVLSCGGLGYDKVAKAKEKLFCSKETAENYFRNKKPENLFEMYGVAI